MIASSMKILLARSHPVRVLFAPWSRKTRACSGSSTDAVEYMGQSVEGDAPDDTDYANYFSSYAFIYHQVCITVYQITSDGELKLSCMTEHS
jgi:hypothetical protein